MTKKKIKNKEGGSWRGSRGREGEGGEEGKGE